MDDLSNENTDPTPVTFFMPGTGENTTINTIVGETDGAIAGVGAIPDIFTFEIADGFELRELKLTNFESSGDDRAMFVAISRGAKFPSSWEEIGSFTADLSLWLGGTATGVDDVQSGLNILPRMNLVGLQNGMAGFSTPLGADQYSFYIQQTGPSNTYALDFIVGEATAVPEPSSTLACCVLTLGAFGYCRFKRKRTSKA